MNIRIFYLARKGLELSSWALGLYKVDEGNG